LALAAAGTATAVAVGVTAIPQPAPPPQPATAYLVSRVTSALGETGAVLYLHMTTTLSGGSFQGSGWQYGTSNRWMAYGRSGQPVMDSQNYDSPAPTAHTPGKGFSITVDYRAKTVMYWHFPLPATAAPKTGRAARKPPSIGAAAALNDFIVLCGIQVPTWLSGAQTGGCLEQMRALIAHGPVQVIGHQRLGGTNTIVIRLTSPYGRTSLTIWINAASYLPILTTIASDKDGYERTGMASGWLIKETTEFEWLPPTRANLAQLNAPIPAGFLVTG
jgi:hypothetical protein